MNTQMDFQTNGYVVTTGVGNPPEQTYGGGNKHHRVRKNNYFTTVVGPAPRYPGLMEININAGTDTVYLPYYQSQVASVHLPSAGPTFFITANMSGCAFYIAKRADNELVVFHANSQLRDAVPQLSPGEQRALTGTAVGTAGGAVIGAIAGNAASGAGIGAAAGLAGGLLVNAWKNNEHRAYEQGYRAGQQSP